MNSNTTNFARVQWIAGMILHPLAFVCGLILLLHGLGRLQQMGWLNIGELDTAEVTESDVTYICPMMCVEPTNAPGRCPVCAMELVPAAGDMGSGDGISVIIDSETRRLINIKTAPVVRRPLELTIDAVGEIGYDETRLRTLAAYVDGRIEELYAGYTGVVVQQGQPLAKIYSPKLYAGQVELLMARQTMSNRLPTSPPGTNIASVTSTPNLASLRTTMYDSSYRRLIELGMTPQQIDSLERRGEADSRLQLVAPISGTVIEKSSVDGQYVKEGDVIYRLADLSQVWLLLKLFPADAAMIEPGQVVQAEVQSLPNRKFDGIIEFILPNVEPDTKTVNVRVVIPNPAGLLRIGDYARATIRVVPDRSNDEQLNAMADPTATDDQPLWIPRDAVLHVGQTSIAYVETESGRFEIRWLTTGPTVDGEIVVWEGLQAGESVATGANFLLDSQMQLTQGPSLINPHKAIPRSRADFEWTEEMLAAMEPLSPEDRELVMQQKLCPVAQEPLGSMGLPLKVDVGGRAVFICCEGCRRPLVEEPEKYLPTLEVLQQAEHH